MKFTFISSLGISYEYMTVSFGQIRIYMHGLVYEQFTIFHQTNVHICTFKLRTVEKWCS